MIDLGTELQHLWKECQSYGWPLYITTLGAGKITIMGLTWEVHCDLCGTELTGLALRRLWYEAMKRHEEAE